MSKKKIKSKKIKKSKGIDSDNINIGFKKDLICDDYTDLLFQDPVVSKRLDDLYLILKKKSLESKSFAEIEEKLNESTISSVPDYGNFYSYVGGLIEINLDVALPNFEQFINPKGISGDTPQAICLLLTFREYKKKIILCLKKNIAIKQTKDYSKYKLLYGTVTKMGERFTKAIVNGLSDIEDEHMDEGLEKLDWFQLKDRFMMAIVRKEKSVAFKLLGRLSNLDPGESYYFEALAHFNNNEFDDSIRFAKKIVIGSPDHNNAVAMILKSYALKGDVLNFTKYMFEVNEIKVNSYFYLNLVQLLILNTKNTDLFLDKMNMDLIRDRNEESKFDDSEHLESKRILCRNCAKLALERIELLDEIELYGSESENDEIPDVLGNRLIQITIAIGVVPEIAEEISKEDSTKDEISQYILKLLLGNYLPEFEDYYLALTTQLRLSISDRFVENVTSNGKKLLLYKDPRAWELIEAAYVESIIIGDKKNEFKLVELLKPSGRLDNRKLDGLITNINIKNSLSNEGKIAYTSAEWQYQKAIEEDYGWKDAGMISLAYFRIIEVELNINFIAPLIKLVGSKNLKEEYNDLINKSSEEHIKKIEEKWESLIFKLERIEKQKNQGLTLEDVERTFGLIKKIDLSTGKVDYNLRKLLYDNMIKLVTNPEGINAINNGEIGELIKSEYRNKYRNPPAHTRYVDIHVAKDCKSYVETALIRISSWINK